MAKRTEFHERDVGLAAELGEALRAEPSRWQRIKGSRRWLVAEPAAGSGEVVVHLTPGLGEGIELIVHPMSAEPGVPLMPRLRERDVVPPTGWQLTGDVGWVISWLAPTATPIGELLDFGLKVAAAVGSAPEDGRWHARLHNSDPRPGRSTGSI